MSTKRSASTREAYSGSNRCVGGESFSDVVKRDRRRAVVEKVAGITFSEGKPTNSNPSSRAVPFPHRRERLDTNVRSDE